MEVSIQKNKITDSELSPEFHGVLKNVYSNEDILKSKQSEVINLQYAIYSLVAIIDSEAVGRILVYKNPFHLIEGEEAISIGYLEVVNALNVWKLLIDEVKDISKELTISSIIGPINGNTWEQYRLTEETEKPLFLSEPIYPFYYKQQLINQGFSIFANYISNIDRTMDWRKERLLKKEEELKSVLTIRPIDIENFKEELESLYSLVVEAFEDNFLYCPIEKEMFIDKYLKLKSIITPELVLVAIDTETGEKVGFIFAFPDLLNKSEKGFIIKTLARNKNRKYAGIGSVLSNIVTKYANENGFTYCIHAFMINSNSSTSISSSFTGELLKKHSLFLCKISHE